MALLERGDDKRLPRLVFYARGFRIDDAHNVDGVAKSVMGLAGALARCGLDVTVLCEGPSAAEAISPRGYRVWRLPSPSISLLPSRCFVDFLAKAKAGGALFILNGMFNPHVAGLAATLRRHGVPYVIAPHDPYHPTVFQTRRLVKRLYWALIERRTLNYSAAIQLLDARHGDYLRLRGIKSDCIAVPNGFDLAEIPPPRSASSWRDGPIRLAFLGRADMHNKGLDLLLHAFAKLKPSNPATLTLRIPRTGDFDRIQALRARLGLDDCVEVLEPAFDVPSTKLLQAFDIACVCSRFEGFSLLAMEAMLAECMVLISDVAGMAPYVEMASAGVAVRANTSDIARGLERLFALRSEWPLRARRGRDCVLTELKWDKIARSAIGDYRELMAKRPNDGKRCAVPTCPRAA